MEEKQSRSSRFASLPGVACLLFLAVLSNYFGAWLISAFFFLLFLLCGGSMIWSRRVLKRAELTVTPLRRECHAGEMLTLELRLRNHSFFPLTWLDVILPVGEKPILRLPSEKTSSWYMTEGSWKAQAGLRTRFVWLLWQQEIRWQEEVAAVRRGTVRIGGAQMQAGDGFGLSAGGYWLRFPAPLRLVVYPRLVPVSSQPFLKIAQEAAARNRGQTEDVTILKSSRPYQPGDPVKRINWRLLALGRPMEVNVYETVMPGCMTFLLDLSSFRVLREVENSQGGTEEEWFLLEREMEQMISLAASCLREIAARGIPVALILPAYGSREAVFCLPEEQEEDPASRCLEALAEIVYEGEKTRFPYEEFWQIAHRLGNLYICARTDAGSSLDELARELGRGRVRYVAGRKTAGENGEFSCLYREELCLEPGDWSEIEKEVRIQYAGHS